MYPRRLSRTALILLTASLAGAIPSQPRAQDQALSVRITSPLGRTGVTGAVRIVAQVHYAPSAPPGQVRFFVDEQLLGAVHQPPYAVEWLDENPFERREIAVRAIDALGNEAADRIVLEPFEVTDSADVTSVLLELSVQDKQGRFITGMNASAFRVAEDDVEQSLDLVHQEALGATFAMLVDASASMANRMEFVQRTAGTLAGYMTARDRMVIAPFAAAMGTLTGPTDDRDTIIQSIRAIHPGGGTAILDSLVHVSKALAAAEGRRAIVLITDGYDEHSSTSFDDALAAVKSVGATVYVVGIGGVAGISLKGERLLRQLAVETGGRFFFPSRDEQLAEVHDVLTRDVQNRYLVTYTPQNQQADGSWRVVTVRTTNPEHVVRTRPGYFAPKPAPIRPAIEFTATDAQGNYLDLTSEDLEIVENGEIQQLETFQEAVQPVSVVLALDASGSMRRKEQDVVVSAREFIDALRPQDKLGVVLFADRPVFAHDLSTNRVAAQAAVDEYQARGGTALYDALSDSLERLKRSEGRRVVVVMTDGKDEDNPGTGPGSVRRLDDVAKLIQESGALVFSIGLGTSVDRNTLQSIADLSGGRAFFPQEVEELASEYRRVVDDLRRRYVVGYTSSFIQRDGTWRDVRIRVRNAPDAAVRSSGGYFAPAQ
jgi:Ca-activated chloride channel homolog